MKQGLTLVETMVSVCLFFLVVILVFNLYPSSLVSLRKGQQRSRADRLAQTQLNETRGQAYASLVPGTVSAGSLQEDGTTYTWQVAIREVPGADKDRLRSLLVGVYWTERDLPQSSFHEVWVGNVTR